MKRVRFPLEQMRGAASRPRHTCAGQTIGVSRAVCDRSWGHQPEYPDGLQVTKAYDAELFFAMHGAADGPGEALRLLDLGRLGPDQTELAARKCGQQGHRFLSVLLSILHRRFARSHPHERLNVDEVLRTVRFQEFPERRRKRERTIVRGPIRTGIVRQIEE